MARGANLKACMQLCQKVEKVLERVGSKRVIVGHTVQVRAFAGPPAADVPRLAMRSRASNPVRYVSKCWDCAGQRNEQVRGEGAADGCGHDTMDPWQEPCSFHVQGWRHQTCGCTSPLVKTILLCTYEAVWYAIKLHGHLLFVFRFFRGLQQDLV